MAQYSYSRDFNPPAPVLPIRVTPPGSSRGLMLRALVDSGASMTVLPAQVVKDLRLARVGWATAAGAFDDRSAEREVFAVELATEFAPPEIAQVIVFSKSYALLGRITLDGPNQVVEIS